MNRVTVRMGALAALSAMLLGCTSVLPFNDAAVLGDMRQKGKDDASATPRAPGAPTNIAGVVKQAQAQRKNGDFTGAAHTLSQLVLLAPDDARVLGEYGKTLIAMGRADDALAFLERAVELQPRDWSLFSAEGVAYDQKGEYAAAQAAYGRALQLKPGDPTVLSNAALSHVQTGDLDEAEALLMQASPSSAEFPRIASNLALVRSLKGSRPTQAALPAAKEMTLIPVPPPAESPSAPEPPVAAPPIPEQEASGIAQAPQPARLAEMPADTATVPAATPDASKPTQPDSSVPMQIIVPEPGAKPKPAQARSKPSRIASKNEPIPQMRPTPDDDKPGANHPKTGDAKKPTSTAALENKAPASDSLGLRPAVDDPPARREANVQH